jgi:hypothetical protein
MQTFPQDNRAESLEIDLHLLRRRVSQMMFGKINWAELNDVQRQEVDETIDEGLRQYYFPPPLPPPFAIVMDMVHEWSFMRPFHEFQTSPNQRTYPLPANFERPIGEIYYQADEDDYYGPIPFTNSTRTLKLANRQEEQSPPRFASINAAQSTGVDPQVQELTLHPTPDAEYGLTFQYQAVARRLTEDQPYPLGGQMHGPGILASCLAAAETRMTGSQGSRYMTFLSMLAGNIARDTQRNAGVLGYNGNNRSYRAWGRGEVREYGGVFYQDVDYGGYMSS